VRPAARSPSPACERGGHREGNQQGQPISIGGVSRGRVPRAEQEGDYDEYANQHQQPARGVGRFEELADAHPQLTRCNQHGSALEVLLHPLRGALADRLKARLQPLPNAKQGGEVRLEMRVVDAGGEGQREQVQQE
jgi:hypothetical protein